MRLAASCKRADRSGVFMALLLGVALVTPRWLASPLTD